MDNFDNNALKIANYLEDRMSAAEEVEFMNQLGRDTELRDQFEEELQIRALLKDELTKRKDDMDALLQPADEHISMMQETLGDDRDKKRQGKVTVRQMLYQYRSIAAVLLIGFLGIVLYLALRPEKNSDTRIVGTNAKNDTSTKHEPRTINSHTPDTTGMHKSSVDTKALFAQFHSAYDGHNDPVEISLYYDKYKGRRYEDVLNATESDYQVMGANNKKNILKQYMDLYKGLSLFDQNKTDDALKQFVLVLQSPAGVNKAYYAAQWYTLLATLRNNDLASARNQASKIASTSTPYKQQAAKLRSALQ